MQGLVETDKAEGAGLKMLIAKDEQLVPGMSIADRAKDSPNGYKTTPSPTNYNTCAGGEAGGGRGA